jgi:hypothetical protein
VATFDYNPITGQLDLVGSGGSVIDGEVATFADLPQTAGTPPVGSSYLVRESTGVWLVNRRQAGIYIRTNNTGVRADDWSYGGDFPVQSVNGQTGAVTIPAFSYGIGGSGLVPQATGGAGGQYLRGDGNWSSLPVFAGNSVGLVPLSEQTDAAKYLKGNGTWSDEPVTPTEVEADYFDRGGDNAATRSGTGGQKRYQIVLSNDTRLTDARQMLWSSPPPTSPTNNTSGRALGSMSYDGSYLYILVQEVGGQSARWARTPMAINW